MIEPPMSTRYKDLKLMVCSGWDACVRVSTYLKGWASARRDVSLAIITIANEPETFVRLGITRSPALVLDGRVLAQNFSVDELPEWLQFFLKGEENSSISAGEE